MPNKRFFAFLFLIITAFACTKTAEYSIPASELAQSFIPFNKDSILFVSTDVLDTQYLSYTNYNSSFSSGSITTQRVEQFASNSDSSFFLSYTLQSGFPMDEKTGGPSKKDQLDLISNSTSKTIFISANSLSGNLSYSDTLVVNTVRYLDVFSDDNSYYFTLEDGIIAYFNGADWYYK